MTNHKGIVKLNIQRTEYYATTEYSSFKRNDMVITLNTAMWCI